MTSRPPAVPPGWAVIPDPSPLAPAAIRVAPAAPAVAFAFVPADPYAGYLSRVPHRVEEFTEGHHAYRVAVQQHIGEFLRIIRDGGVDPQPYVVAIRMVAFTLARRPELTRGPRAACIPVGPQVRGRAERGRCSTSLEVAHPLSPSRRGCEAARSCHRSGA